MNTCEKVFYFFESLYVEQIIVSTFKLFTANQTNEICEMNYR